MSKAENGFKLIQYIKYKETLTALSRSCEWIAEECDRCPLEGDQQCARKQLPPAFIGEWGSKGRDITVCQDWLCLYFMSPEGKPDEEVEEKTTNDNRPT